jgi:hypothetical protein
MLPTIGRIVHYRGKLGMQTLRPAMVVVTVDNLDQRGVDAGLIEPLDSPEHVHLQVFGPGEMFHEYNVPPGDEPGHWSWPPRV